MTKQTISRRTAVVAALAAAALGLGGMAVLHDPAQAEGDAVSLDYARNALETGQSTLFDIREPQEHATGVAQGAQLLPMRQLQSRLSEIPKDPTRPVLLICNTQSRSRSTLAMLREKGYTNVRFVQGGMSEWARRGWPMVPPVSR